MNRKKLKDLGKKVEVKFKEGEISVRLNFPRSEARQAREYFGREKGYQVRELARNENGYGLLIEPN